MKTITDRDSLEKLRKEELIKSFKRAAKEPELTVMTEEGLEDYLEILKNEILKY
jgi:hypothetical protein